MKKESRESLELRANFTKVEQFEYFLNSIRQNYEKKFFRARQDSNLQSSDP